jgi:anthranilate synthase component 2
VHVYRNDQISVDACIALKPEHIVISPGPGSPRTAGISVNLIQKTYKTTPILGVCLGHQCLAYAFGASIIQSQQIMHGKISTVSHDKSKLFKNIKDKLDVTRYHSLSIDRATLPPELEVNAQTDDEDHEIMAISHQLLPVFGVQFHPEALLTEQGLNLLDNFLAYESPKCASKNSTTKKIPA